MKAQNSIKHYFLKLYAKNPQKAATIIWILIIIVFVILAYFIYINYRQFKQIQDLPRNIKGLNIKGYVTAVRDGDGFRMIHKPFLRSLDQSKHPKTLPIRLAGIDAPEMASFGCTAQACSKESTDFLKNIIFHKFVHIQILGIDLYQRILAIVWIKTGVFSWTNVNLTLLEEGMACVYNSAGAVYGKYENIFKIAEEKAKKSKKGIWKDKKNISPMEFKKKKKQALNLYMNSKNRL